MKPNKTSILSRRIYFPSHVNGHDVVPIIKLFLLVFIIPHSLPTVSPQSNPDGNTIMPRPKFDPTMAILMIGLIIVFFLLGFFSVYVRHCAERAFGFDYGRPIDPGAWNNVRGDRRGGLDPSVIESFPTYLYSTVKGLRIGKEALECAVCLNEFEDTETLRLLPKCSHVFHPACIDAWLQFHSTCPLCRAYLVPQPGEPVSFHLPERSPELELRPGSDHRRRVLDSPDVRLIESVSWTNRNRPPRRSRSSTGRKLTGLLPRSNSTGELLVQVQPGENLDRFTLRMTEEEQSRLVNSKSHVVLSQERSSRSGFRSGDVVGRERKNYFYNDRFENEGRFDRRPFSITPPYQTGFLRSPNVAGDGGIEDLGRATPPKGLLQSLRSPLDRLFLGKDQTGERSTDRLR